jgi:hypothetical protein
LAEFIGKLAFVRREPYRLGLLSQFDMPAGQFLPSVAPLFADPVAELFRALLIQNGANICAIQ